MVTSIERQTMKKVYLRLLPFCFALYFICYLDRVNIGFAALTMNKDLGLSSYIFGLGAGAFFWGYFILEVPSNLILDRVGARRWIARIMVTWGLVSGAFAFISGPVSFFTLRFLLGLAEAGFFPGMILYFTYWFPPSHRARIVAGFMAAIPVSIGLGAPISTSLLELDGVLGIAGWRWLFLCEAAPAVIFGIATFFYLTDRPAQADWLEAEEREWLATEMEKERQDGRDRSHYLGAPVALQPARARACCNPFRPSRRQCRDRGVCRADHQAARSDQHADRLHHRNPLCARDHRHDRLGQLFRSQERAAVEPDRLLHDDGGGMPDRRAARQQLLGGGGAVARHDRPIRVATPICSRCRRCS